MRAYFIDGQNSKKTLLAILLPVMIFAMLYRCPHFDKISVRIIKAYDFLSPAVCHESVDVFHFRIILFEPVDKTLNTRLLKIELAGIVFRNDISSKELSPVFSSCNTNPSVRIILPP